MEKAKKAAPKKANQLKTVVAAAAITTAVSCSEPEEKQSNAIPENKQYNGDAWEKTMALHNGLPICTLQPTGNIVHDFSAFTMGQGGGKSYDKSDSIASNPNNYFKTPDKDGRFPHTVNDITKAFFVTWAPKVGIRPTAENFYNMTMEQHDLICDAWINSTKETDSDVCNMVLDLAEWGSGGYGRTQLIQMWRNETGKNIGKVLEFGEYNAFLKLLQLRERAMQAIPDRIYEDGKLILSSNENKLTPKSGQTKRGGWPTYGMGWGSGLAHFHRVFKIYCK